MAINFPTELINSNPSFSLVDIEEIRGTSRPLNQISDTGSIQPNERKIGQLVFLTSSAEYWGYFGQTTSSWNDPTKWAFLFNISGSSSGSGGTGLPTGSDREVQFNDSGSFGASPNFKFLIDDTLSLTGSIHINQTTSSIPFLINLSGSNGEEEKFKINEEGVLVLGSFEDEPSLVLGGMYYGEDGEYYLAFTTSSLQNLLLLNQGSGSILLNNNNPILINS